MRRRAAWLVVFASALIVGCLHPPLVWSPDGRWLAYTVAVRPVGQALEPGWLFDTAESPGDDRLGWAEPSRRPEITAYRLWATRAETGASVLLEESAGPLTSPVWSPDGRSLAFGRLVLEGEGRSRFEVVIQDAPDRKRVVLAQPVPVGNPKASELPALSLAWSPDGRYLAVPWFQQTLALAIVRADNGGILKVVEDAYLPAWSPDGSKLAFLRGTEPASLHYLDTNFGPPRHLADLVQPCQAPTWSKDRRTVLIVARPTARPQGAPPPRGPCLVRVPIDGGPPEVTTLPAHQAAVDRPELGSSFSFGVDGDGVLYAVDLRDRESVFMWYRPRSKEVYRNENPLDPSIRLGSLAVSPGGKTLAFRAGAPGVSPPPGLWDLAAYRFTPVVPDDSARVEWVATLVSGARELLRRALPAPEVEAGKPVERATVLPIPGELAANPALDSRLRRLGRLGRPLCDRPANAPPADPAVLTLLDEAKLFFDYLRGDYDAALAALEALEAGTTSPEHRIRLLSVRAQIFLARKQDDRAERTIEYLESLERVVPKRLEVTPAGSFVTEEANAGQGWSRYLALRADEWKKAQSAAPDEPLGHRNPDAPEPPAGVAMPFAPPGPATREALPLIFDPDIPPPGAFRPPPRRFVIPPQPRRRVMPPVRLLPPGAVR